jgi:hypothetical protein
MSLVSLTSLVALWCRWSHLVSPGGCQIRIDARLQIAIPIP